LGCLIGFTIIYNYNSEVAKINYPVENIFIPLMLIGLDMLRVFAIRIIKNKNPFLPDRTHLHHLLLKRKTRLSTILMIFFILILTPVIISQFLNILQI
jgi:UDP-GlcNAc:undecaprenyl-phosphate GlcNAc-1-phosphate transferase